MKRYLLAAAVFFVFAAAPDAWAEDGDLERRLDEQQREIDELRDKLDAMEESGRLKEEAERDMAGIMPAFGKNLGAFGDINYFSETRESYDNDGFSLGTLSLFSTAAIGERTNLLFEMALVSHNSRTTVSVERFWASYAYSDPLTVRAGRFHTALGYWNKTYHHGKHLFNTVERPFFIKFESIGGVVPVHIVGLEATGSFDAGLGRARYWIEYGNGASFKYDPHTGKQRLVVNSKFDVDESKQGVVRLSLSPSALRGLSLGLSYSRLNIDTPSFQGLDQDIYVADVHYENGIADVTAELFRFKNDTHSAKAWYVEVSRGIGSYTPFVRYETLDASAGDPYLGALSGGTSREQRIAGVRYDIDPVHSSIKVQYRGDELEGSADYDIFEAQWSFFF